MDETERLYTASINSLTVKERMIKKLIEEGLWDEDAVTILDEYIADFEGVRDVQWNSPSVGYPAVAYSAMWISLKPYVLRWIDKNAPRAFYRETFV